MPPEQRAVYIKKKSVQNSNRPGISEQRKKYNASVKGRYASYRHDAMRRYRNYEFSITIEEFSSLLLGSCHYCGKASANGVDRVRNAEGYTTNNCVSCCQVCNQMKMDRSVEDFMAQCRKIIENMDK